MNNKKQRNRLFTMLMLVMVILMPYGGGHGHRRLVNRQWVTVVNPILTKYPQLRNWHGFVIM